MKFIKKLCRKEDGWVTTMVAILLPLFFMFAAFGLDWGRVYLLKHQLQSAADAASLAGASAVESTFIFDSDGDVVGDRLVLNPTKAEIYAADLINANINANDFERQGVKNIKFEGNTLDADNDGYLESYHTTIEADIETFLVGPMTGYGGTVHVTREAQARAKKIP